MPGGQDPTDEQILSWWNHTHEEQADAVTSDVALAYRRTKALAAIDAALATHLSSTELAQIAKLLPPSAPPLTAHDRDDDAR